MKELIKNINEWIKETIKTKKALNETIRGLKNHIDQMLKTMKEYETAKDYAIEQMNKYKTRLSESNKKYCELEIKTNEEVSKLNKELKSLQRQNKKLEKELKNVQM